MITETDQELRERISKNPSNGSYATKICRGCGAFWYAQDGRVEDAIIVDKCGECLDRTQERTNE